MLTKDKMKAYIAFFEDDNQVFYSILNGYINYHETVEMFIKDCYDSDVMDTEYLIRLKGDLEKNIDLHELIEREDIIKSKAILTFYIRGERFNEGMIAKAIDKKIFSNILKKLI